MALRGLRAATGDVSAMSGLKSHVCEAARCGPLMACGRCSLTCPASGETLACKDKPDPPITLPSMGAFLAARAQQLEQSQAALVTTGDRQDPWMPALNEAAAYRAADRLLALINDDPQLLDLIKQKSAR